MPRRLTGMDGIESLRHAIETIPIPGAPPRLSRQGAAVGLALLDTSLRLNHVRRLTERLTVVDHGAARRSTEIDVSLKLLDEGQRQATAQLQDLIGREHGERAASRPAQQRALWVPLARLPRRDASPVDVFDSAGQKLPRLTQHEASRLVASGLYRLLRGILAGDENAQTAKHELNTFLFQVHEPRWLIQQALLTLLTERNHPEEAFTLAPAEGTVPGYGRECREMALDILDGYAELLVEYAYLLTAGKPGPLWTDRASAASQNPGTVHLRLVDRDEARHVRRLFLRLARRRVDPLEHKRGEAVGGGGNRVDQGEGLLRVGS
jgi:hypothetical protein